MWKIIKIMLLGIGHRNCPVCNTSGNYSQCPIYEFIDNLLKK